MTLIFFSAFVLSILACSCGFEDKLNIERKFVVSSSTTNLDYSYIKCPIVCTFGVNSTVIVQTAVDNSTKLNIPVRGGPMTIVYYRCNKYKTEFDGVHRQFHTFQKLCENRTENCTEFSSSFEGQWESMKTGLRPTLQVDFRLSHNATEAEIKISKCADEEIKFKFDIPVDDRLDDKIHRFYIKNNEPLRIKLSIIKYHQESIADVVFSVQRSKCESGWHQKSDNVRGYKCVVIVDNSTLEAGYTAELCPEFGPLSYRALLCRGRLYITGNCSYLCVIPVEGGLAEGGYLMDTNVTYQDCLGSRGWDKDNMPVDLVHLNECIYGYKLCVLGDGFCRDKIVSFSCSVGSYNMSQCLAGKIVSRYWRCPVDAHAIALVTSQPYLLKNIVDSKFYMNQVLYTFKRKIKSIEELNDLSDILRILFGINGISFFNFQIEDRKYFATMLLNVFVDNLFVAGSSIIPNRSFENDIFYYRSKQIKEDEEEIDMLTSPSSNRRQFVRIRLSNRNVHNKRNGTQNVKCIQFKNLDMMNEDGRIVNFTRRMTFLYNDISSEQRVLIKNSVIFSLKIDDESSLQFVRFSLNTFVKVDTVSWLYETDNVCGFLDPTKNWTWSTRGCRLVTTREGSYCECDHLSNFAMLFLSRRIREVHLKFMGVLSISGAVVSLTSLLLFVIFVLCVNTRDKIRIDQLNISLCLLLGTLIYMLGALFSLDKTLCSVAAMATQFLILSAFTWKLIFGINVIRLVASLRFQNEDWLVKYRWILVSAGYGLPFIIVSVSGCLFWEDYSRVSSTVCWIDSNSSAFLGFLVPVGLILAMNTVGLFFIANTLIRNYIKTRNVRMTESSELFVFIQLFASMGLTWLPSYFATTYVWAMYIFVLFFPLQGLLMFLLVVVINKENREKVSSLFSINSKSASAADPKTNSKFKLSRSSKETEMDNQTGEANVESENRDRKSNRYFATCVTKS